MTRQKIRKFLIFKNQEDDHAEQVISGEIKEWSTGNPFNSIKNYNGEPVLFLAGNYMGDTCYLLGDSEGEIIKRGESRFIDHPWKHGYSGKCNYPISENTGINSPVKLESFLSIAFKDEDLTQPAKKRSLMKSGFYGYVREEDIKNLFSETTQKTPQEDIFKKPPFPYAYHPKMESEDFYAEQRGEKRKYYQGTYDTVKKIIRVFEEDYTEEEFLKILSLILVRHMQSGKTEIAQCLIETCLIPAGLSPDEIIFFITLPDRKSNLDLLKSMSGIATSMTVHEIREEIKRNPDFLDRFKVFIKDELSFAFGEKSRVSDIVDAVNSLSPTSGIYPRLSLSLDATPMYAKLTSKSKYVYSPTGVGHTGVKQFLEKNQIFDIEKDPYFSDIPDGNRKEGIKMVSSSGLNPIYEEEIKRMVQDPDVCIGIVRDEEIIHHKNQLEIHLRQEGMSKKVTVVTLSCKNSTFGGMPIKGGIKDAIKELQEEIRDIEEGRREPKNYIVICQDSLTASVDLDDKGRYKIKEKLSFVFEKRPGATSILQGLLGRACGYHLNEKIHIYCNKSIAEVYSEFIKSCERGEDVEEAAKNLFDMLADIGGGQGTHISQRTTNEQEFYIPSESIELDFESAEDEILNYAIGDEEKRIVASRMIKGIKRANLGNFGNINSTVSTRSSLHRIEGYIPYSKTRSNNTVDTKRYMEDLKSTRKGKFNFANFLPSKTETEKISAISKGIGFLISDDPSLPEAKWKLTVIFPIGNVESKKKMGRLRNTSYADKI